MDLELLTPASDPAIDTVSTNTRLEFFSVQTGYKTNAFGLCFVLCRFAD